MAEREAYARGQACDVKRGVECHPGVEIRDGDDVDELTHHVQAIAASALQQWGGNHIAVVESVEAAIKEKWPGRAYFIETDEAGRGVQVYQPYGMPRGRT